MRGLASMLLGSVPAGWRALMACDGGCMLPYRANGDRWLCLRSIHCMRVASLHVLGTRLQPSMIRPNSNKMSDRACYSVDMCSSVADKR
jgi:hypothetical protein